MGGPDRLAARRRHGAHALDQYDADAAPRSVARRCIPPRPWARICPPATPRSTPRWLLMMAGGLFIGGLWLVYLAGRSTFTADEKKFVAGLGGKVAAGFGVVYLAAGFWAASVQPEAVKAGLAGHAVYPALQVCRVRRLRLDRAGGCCRSCRRDRRLRQNQRRLALRGPASCTPCCSKSCSPSIATACAT